MGAFYLIGAICIISFIIVCFNDGWASFLFSVAGTLSLVAILFMGVSLINRERSFDEVVIEYAITKQLVESYEGGEYGNVYPLMESIIGINKKISTHKSYVNNKWTGAWYSEKIANLEPLMFKKAE